MKRWFRNNRAEDELESRYGKAKVIINNEDKMEKFLQNLERKLQRIPKLGGKLSSVLVLISLLRSHHKGEYRHLPVSSLITIVAALIYFLSPVDFIPDFFIGIGFVDDAAVIALTLSKIEEDVQDYKIWREENGKVGDF